MSPARLRPTRRRRGAGLLPGLMLCGTAFAVHAAPAVAPSPVPSAASGIMHVLFGLAIVLLVMWACAWALKRYTGAKHTGAGSLRVVGAVAVGQRERVVMVEVGETWLIVGVAHGHVSALHTMARLPAAAPPAGAQQPAGGFAARFTQILERRNHGR